MQKLKSCINGIYKRCCRSFARKNVSEASGTSLGRCDGSERTSSSLLIDIYYGTKAQVCCSNYCPSQQRLDKNTKERRTCHGEHKETDVLIQIKAEPDSVHCSDCCPRHHPANQNFKKRRNEEHKEEDESQAETDSQVSCCDCCPSYQREDQKTKRQRKYSDEEHKKAKTVPSDLDNSEDKNGADLEEKVDRECDCSLSIITIAKY